MSSRMEKLQTRWQDSKMVSTREKVAFVLGVMNVLVSALLLGFRPEWMCVFSLLLIVSARSGSDDVINQTLVLLDTAHFSITNPSVHLSQKVISLLSARLLLPFQHHVYALPLGFPAVGVSAGSLLCA